MPSIQYAVCELGACACVCL